MLATALITLAGWAVPAQSAGTEIRVFKSPTCGCCAAWAEYARSNGFEVRVEEIADMDKVKRDLGVPADLASCHTATAGGYVIEGHVPASSIRKLLKEHPANVKGIAVRGMPQGSPGMSGTKSSPIEVVAFEKAGKTRLFDRW